MSLYGVVGGINKEIIEIYGLSDGINRQTSQIYGLSNGINKLIYEAISTITITKASGGINSGSGAQFQYGISSSATTPPSKYIPDGDDIILNPGDYIWVRCKITNITSTSPLSTTFNIIGEEIVITRTSRSDTNYHYACTSNTVTKNTTNRTYMCIGTE